MVGYQLNIATNSKMIHKSKGSILLIWNLLNFDWGTHIFLTSIGRLIHGEWTKACLSFDQDPLTSWLVGVNLPLSGTPCPLNAQ